jgi:4-carboxymuconolactone decarboxylase
VITLASMVGDSQDLLRRLSANEESSVRTVMALHPDRTDSSGAVDTILPPSVRMLVRLAALLALDASTTSLRWAVELASCTGADEDAILRVLAIVGSEVGFPRVVSTAPRLALAIGYEIELEGWDGS